MYAVFEASFEGLSSSDIGVDRYVIKKVLFSVYDANENRHTCDFVEHSFYLF
jgi:hypothetical protein